jgi:hypothetical protein
MSREINVDVQIARAAYSSRDRVFNRATVSVASATDITDKIFVVNTLYQPGSQVFLYVATPADLSVIPEDTPNTEGLLRVSSFMVDYDRDGILDEYLSRVQSRVQLLLDTLKVLDTPQESYDFTVVD